MSLGWAGLETGLGPQAYEVRSAFIPGGLITDNVMLAFETSPYLRRQRKGKVGMSALKIDKIKAYDRIEW